MQSNGNAVQPISETKLSENSGQSPPKEKKTPPKSPKRVSFDLTYRTIAHTRPSSIDETETTKVIVTSSKTATKETSCLNGSSVKESSKFDVIESGVVLQKTTDDHKSDKTSDKTPSPTKVNTTVCDTGQNKIDNVTSDVVKKENQPEINKTITEPVKLSPKEKLRNDFVNTNEHQKYTTSDRLREEFVKSPVSPTKSSWTNKNSDNRSSYDSKSPLQSPSPDLSNRLSETQSKIARLQQSLPTKLSEATVESLKNKYSPASFGYPKSFAKSPTELSRIPSFTSKIAKSTKLESSIPVKKELDVKESASTDVKEAAQKQIEVKKSDTKFESTPNNTIIIQNGTRKVTSTQTFRSELFITPASSEGNPPPVEAINKNESHKQETNEIVNASTIKTKFICSEIFPKEQSSIDTSDSLEDILNEDTSEQSSDTITESEDSQNVKFRNKPLEAKEDAENNNLTETDPDSSSFTSEINSCEVLEEDNCANPQEMEDSKNKKPQKKRSNSFKKIFGFGSKDKKKDDTKNTSKGTTNGMKKNDMLSDNAQNEANFFDRNQSQRHTISGQYSRDWDRRTGSTKENVPSEPFYANSNARYQNMYQQEQYSRNSSLPAPSNRQTNSLQNTGILAEERLNQIKFDLYVAQQTNQQLNSNLVMQQRNVDEYVCMDNNDKPTKPHLTQPGFINAHSIDKYIDTTSSSSISTLESENRNIIYENTVKSNNRPAKVQNTTKIPVPSNFSPDKNINKETPSPGGEKCYERPKFADSPEIFTTTPRRAQGPQLIKPKAIIPINTERALPNPYRGIRDPQQSKSSDPSIAENYYGNLPSPENSNTINSNLNDIKKQYPNKDTPVYGKPVAASRRTIPGNDATYGNISKNESNIIVEDDYGTVYDSLTPVGAQLVVSKPQFLTGGKNMEKRSRSVSPSQKHKAINLSSSQSFNYKNRSQIPSPASPNRKELEATKLHLPAKREKLQLKLKSPIEERRKSSDAKKDNKNIPSHQNLEIEIDYPENNLNENLDRKETPEKFMFTSNDNVPLSPKKNTNLKRSTHVSPNRPKSFTHSTPKHQSIEQVKLNDYQSSDTGYSEISRATNMRSPIRMRSESPASISSSLSLSSISTKSKPVSTQDLKDLKNTEVYFYEQTTNQNVKKEDVSPDQSPQQVLTQATVHQPKSSPRKLEPSPTPEIRRTPVNQLPIQAVPGRIPGSPSSPQKQQNMQNVEAFYWQQIKKLKEKEEQEIYNQHVQMMARQNTMQVPSEYVVSQHRSRSLSNPHRGAQRRSASLPRDVNPSVMGQRANADIYGYARTGRQYPIPEGVIVRSNQNRPASVTPQNNNNFIRGSPQRSTVGPINTQKRVQPVQQNIIYENYFPGVDLRNQAKSVSSSGGYAPIFKKGSLTESAPVNSRDTSPQTNKKVSFSSAQEDSQNWPTKNGFTQSPPTRRVDKRVSLDDEVFLPSQVEPQYVPRQQFQPSEPLYVTKLPPSHPREPIYGRTSGNKQITVTNKVCDMYGQIHEMQNPSQKIYGHIQKTGVIYGQLQQNPLPGSPLSIRNQSLNRSDPSFVRGNRLTASFNDAPRRPLPPIPASDVAGIQKFYGRVHPAVSESESGSEAGEVQRILAQKERRRQIEEEWNSDSKSGRSQSGGESGRGGGDGEGEVRSSRSARSGRRDDPRRHTLSGSDPHYPGGMAVQGGPLSRTMDLEVPMPRGYPPPSSAMLFDDDPGIMSEVETSSTGFRRGGKQRSSLPVVRTPSKTLERPLGLVFLQYRNETKRALLPNEITSIDTVKALFVRSFPKQLTMEYLDSPLVKIYIHDSSKDMFYELEDLRSHLRDIRDRSVLRLFESADVSGGLPGPGTGISGGVGHFEDQSYFSEPEFDSEYQHQHIHKSKTSGAKAAPPYYMGSTTLPRGGPLLRAYSPAIGGPIPADRLKTLPAGAPPKPLRTYSSLGRGPGVGLPDRYNNTFHSQADLRLRSDNPLFSMPDRIHTDGYMSSPERGSRGQYEDPYYSQYAARSGSITPVIDEEASDTELLDESYSLYGVKLPPPGGPRAVPAPRTQFPAAPAAVTVPYDATRYVHRLRVENMERQLANLTGLVQKALHQTPPSTREFLQVPGGRDSYRPDKSVSFEKSVSFSDEPPDMNSPKQHSPQHTERDRLKPAPPPKPASLSPAQYDNSRHIYRDLQLTPEMYNQLRGLQKKAKDLRTEVRNLRRLSQAQAHSVRETIRDTFIKIRAMLLASGDQVWQAGLDQEKVRLSREEDLYKQEMIRLEKDLTELEATVEELRGNVINRKTRVNMSDVENMALILSKSSKTVADLKLRFPGLQDAMKNLLTSEMEKVVREEKFLKEEPERLESALRRCKKLTGTLVTLKRLASVQEQRLPCSNSTDGRLSPTLTETPPITPPSAQHSKPPTGSNARNVLGQSLIGGDSTGSSCDSSQRPENALDALLDELQTFSKPHPITSSTPSTVTTQLPQAASFKVAGSTPSMGEIGRKGSMDSATLLPIQNLTVSTATGSLRRLHSYPSGSDTDNSPPIQPLARASNANKPPIPERNAELLQHLASGRRVPPPPPPRTSSKSPLASPTSPSLPPRGAPNQNALQHIQNVQNMTEKPPQSQFEAATQNLGLGTLRRNVPGRSSLKEKSQTLPRNIGSNLQIQMNSDAPGPENKLNPMSTSNSSSCESVNSQEGAKKGSRKEELEQRHQELLKKQKALQEQYARLQQLQRGNNTLTVVPPAPDLLLKKTGSESNLLQKMGLQMAAPQQMTGSLTHLANASLSTVQQNNTPANPVSSEAPVVNSNPSQTTTAKVYETDIL